ncbi:hypothetical protein Bca52824_024788 [Brassica carinata]|uniref:Uncharacterized protein n=1 Tax=Brassica carinata TaxID=52824 RepID=A0A8X7VL18_BRACI|nr:hypothetical protein Bca52824_024788 [Brassica carinata]
MQIMERDVVMCSLLIEMVYTMSLASINLSEVKLGECGLSDAVVSSIMCPQSRGLRPQRYLACKMCRYRALHLGNGLEGHRCAKRCVM